MRCQSGNCRVSFDYWHEMDNRWGSRNYASHFAAIFKRFSYSLLSSTAAQQTVCIPSLRDRDRYAVAWEAVAYDESVGNATAIGGCSNVANLVKTAAGHGVKLGINFIIKSRPQINGSGWWLRPPSAMVGRIATLEKAATSVALQDL